VLRDRLISAFILIPLILGSVIVGGLVFFALILIALILAGWEFFQMTQQAGYHPNLLFGLALIFLFLLNAFLGGAWTLEILTAALLASLIAAIFWRPEGWAVGWGLTLAGALYVGVLGGYFILMRGLPNGMLLTILVLLTAWATDTSAYIAGKRWGRRGFFTSISPKKTWEGALGGEVASIVTMGVLGTLAGLHPVHAVVLGVVIGIAAALGDLAESVIKRQFGAKDSGAVIPGHGGLLDRVDSLLFAAVFAFYYLRLVVRV
jgi:phosphatidate cytidylyltransferase